MRLRIRWRSRWFQRAVKPSPQHTMATVISGEERDLRGQDSARGAEILENSSVETVELGALAKLPPFRPVVISLLRLFDRRDVKMDEVAALVKSDPTITSELLAVVNSSLFGLRQNVASESHAISLLGVERTRSLAATLATRSLLQNGPRTPVVRRLWTHSIATATIARHFAASFGAAPELSHVAAMLHDLGRSGLLAAHPDAYSRLALAAHESTEEILAQELAEFGMTHCHAGMLLARAWRLPDVLRKTAGHHHEISSADPVVALVQLCCRLADDFMYQAIHRSDIRKPEETIAGYAPERLREHLSSQLAEVNALVVTAIQGLDF